jgi:hypothetical protein
VNRAGRVVPVGRDTRLRAGDEVLALADRDGDGPEPATVFAAPGDN